MLSWQNALACFHHKSASHMEQRHKRHFLTKVILVQITTQLHVAGNFSILICYFKSLLIYLRLPISSANMGHIHMQHLLHKENSFCKHLMALFSNNLAQEDESIKGVFYNVCILEFILTNQRFTGISAIWHVCFIVNFHQSDTLFVSIFQTWCTIRPSSLPWCVCWIPC